MAGVTQGQGGYLPGTTTWVPNLPDYLTQQQGNLYGAQAAQADPYGYSLPGPSARFYADINKNKALQQEQQRQQDLMTLQSQQQQSLLAQQLSGSASQQQAQLGWEREQQQMMNQQAEEDFQRRLAAIQKLQEEQWGRINPYLSDLGFGGGEATGGGYGGGSVGGLGGMGAGLTSTETTPITSAYEEAMRRISNVAPTGRARETMMNDALSARLAALAQAQTGTSRVGAEQYTAQRGQNMSLLSDLLRSLAPGGISL